MNEQPVGRGDGAQPSGRPPPPVPPGRPGAEASARQAWSTLLRATRPRARSGQILTGVLCAVLGFALVAQMRHTQSSGLSALRQSDLVQLLEETTAHSRGLRTEAAELERTRDELLTGSDQQRAALDAATQRAESQGVLSGRLPAVGPGIVLRISDPAGTVGATTLVSVLTELRNAGAEAIQVGDQRVTASTFFLDGPDGVLVDGVLVTAPYRWVVIGDPHTMSQALEIPGGALALVRGEGGDAAVESLDEVVVDATKTPREPRFAEPVGSTE